MCAQQLQHKTVYSRVVYSNNSSLISTASFVKQEAAAHRADPAGGGAGGEVGTKHIKTTLADSLVGWS